MPNLSYNSEILKIKLVGNAFRYVLLINNRILLIYDNNNAKSFYLEGLLDLEKHICSFLTG